MARVLLQNIRKVYPNGFEAVHDTSFEIKDGEFVVLVGPSGCGKSTTLRMIAGLESISDGELYIGDRLVNDVAPKDRDIAMVFQNYALYPHMSVYDNMAFGLKLRKFPKSEIDTRVREAAKTLGIEKELERKPGELSGGQRQRVAVGRAIVRMPQVFLFDEPLSNLDAKLRVQMRTEISQLHSRLEATMIYVTHDQVEAMTMGDRIVVLKDGYVQQIAPPLELYEHPVNQFVAGFIGSPSMNFIPGTIQSGDNGLTFLSANGHIRVSVDRSDVPGLSERVGETLTLGIRPENIYTTARIPAEVEAAVAGTLTIDVLEPMGNEIFVYGKASGDTVVARVAPQELPAVGGSIEIAFALDKLHFFDSETEQSLATLAEVAAD